MKTNNEQTATVNNEATATVDKTATQRVVENREMWQTVFDQTATLLALVAKGENLPENAVSGFAFGKTTDKEGKTVKLVKAQQPHIREYFYSLVAGFASKKAVKAAKKTALENVDLEEVGRKLCLGLWSQFNYDQKVGKAEPKQARSLVEAVLAKM